jgi:sulfate transport system permease protein
MSRISLRMAAFVYLGGMVALPLGTVIHDGLQPGWSSFVAALAQPAAWYALKLTLMTACVMAAMNAIMGTLAAYVLVRYRFPGASFVNSLIDLPFAIPTLVTGVMLAVLYHPEKNLGGWLKAMCGWQILFTPAAVVLALLFVTFPFVVRTVQPVLMELDRDQEEAARTLGASGWTTFRRILFPALLPGILTGTLLGFARAIGEFGSVVVVAGNVPLRSQTAAVYILGEIESQNSQGASAMSTVLFAISFAVILAVDMFQKVREKSHVA